MMRAGVTQPHADAAPTSALFFPPRPSQRDISCRASMNASNISSNGGPSTSKPPSMPQLRVPTSKELERMRQFRQRQQFKQRQQHMRQIQRTMIEGPENSPDDRGSSKEGKGRGRASGREQPSSIQTESRGQRQSKSMGRRRKSSRSDSPTVDADDGLTTAQFKRLMEACELEVSWRATVGILFQLGLRQADLSRLTESRPEVFQMSAKTMKRKLSFLKETVGLTESELTKVVVKAPRILEYQSQSLRKRLEFLKDTGVAAKDVSKVILKAPMILALSIEDTLHPRIEFLKNEMYVPDVSLGKLFARHPQVLTCTEEMMRERAVFLVEECGLGAEELSHAVLAHPQILHYKIDSMRVRIDYLSSIGMLPEQIAASIARFPQLLSLSVASNMAPKWHYLVEHLGGNIASLAGYPGYFSLSLLNRIIPRHRYLQKLKGGDAPMHFSMSILKVSDKKFATEIARSTLSEYEEFKSELINKQKLAEVALGIEHIVNLPLREGCSLDADADLNVAAERMIHPLNLHSDNEASKSEGWLLHLSSSQRLGKVTNISRSRSSIVGDVAGHLSTGSSRNSNPLSAGPSKGGLTMPRQFPLIQRALPENGIT